MKRKEKNKKLHFIVTNYQVSIWPLCMLAEMLMYYFYKLYGENHSGEIIGEWKNRTNKWASEKTYNSEIAETVLKKVEHDHKWTKNIIKDIYRTSKQLLRFTQKIFDANLSEKSDKEIYELYANYRKEFINMYTYAWLPNVIEGQNNIFSSKLEKYLELKLKKLNKIDQIGKYLSVLISPLKKSNREKEEIEFYNIISLILKNNKAKRLFKDKNTEKIQRELKALSPVINKLIIKHCKKYCWLPFDYDGPAWDKEYFLNKVKEIIEKKTNSKRELAKIAAEKNRINKLQKFFFQEIGLNKDSNYNYFFNLARELTYIKDYRKDALFKSYYHINKLIQEIGERLSLSVIQVKHILPKEMKDILLKRKYNIDKINERIKYSVLIYKKAKPGKFPKDRMKIFTGMAAKNLIKKKVKEKEYSNDIRKLKGQSAYSGKAKGAVKLIFATDDIKKMDKGDILVSPATNPNLLPAMRLAAAIITDKGGITCHAAITSRELKTPCVIGTEIATKVLRDGQLVSVDANKGVVNILE